MELSLLLEPLGIGTLWYQMSFAGELFALSSSLVDLNGNEIL
jgi:hypothetical protein